MTKVVEAAKLLADTNILTIEFEGGATADVYIASSIEEKFQGLSELSFLDTFGMLFCFSHDSYVPFTMKDMKMDLTIAFFDEAGTLIQYGSYKAGDGTPVTCPVPYRFVLECPEGFYAGANLKV